MTGHKGISREEKVELDPNELLEKIEFEYVPGSNGNIMLFVKDKNNPKSAAKNNIGFIAKNSDIIAKPEYTDGRLSYFFMNKTANTFMMVSCQKGKETRSEFYLSMGQRRNDVNISDVHLIIDVEFYEKGATSPSLKVFLPTEDYSVNLFKFFWEKMLEKYQ